MSANHARDPNGRNPLPISAPERSKDRNTAQDEPDLHLEEVEDKHIPKDRNIFDK